MEGGAAVAEQTKPSETATLQRPCQLLFSGTPVNVSLPRWPQAPGVAAYAGGQSPSVPAAFRSALQ